VQALCGGLSRRSFVRAEPFQERPQFWLLFQGFREFFQITTAQGNGTSSCDGIRGVGEAEQLLTVVRAQQLHVRREIFGVVRLRNGDLFDELGAPPGSRDHEGL
jgi:hypothetical protein